MMDRMFGTHDAWLLIIEPLPGGIGVRRCAEALLSHGAKHRSRDGTAPAAMFLIRHRISCTIHSTIGAGRP